MSTIIQCKGYVDDYAIPTYRMIKNPTADGRFFPILDLEKSEYYIRDAAMGMKLRLLRYDEVMKHLRESGFTLLEARDYLRELCKDYEKSHQ